VIHDRTGEAGWEDDIGERIDDGDVVLTDSYSSVRAMTVVSEIGPDLPHEAVTRRGVFWEHEEALRYARALDAGAPPGTVGCDHGEDDARAPDAEPKPEYEAGTEPTRVRMSDGSTRPVLGPDQPTNRRLAAIEELLEDVEDDASRARADTKDEGTVRTLVSRVADLERRVGALEEAHPRSAADGGDNHE